VREGVRTRTLYIMHFSIIQKHTALYIPFAAESQSIASTFSQGLNVIKKIKRALSTSPSHSSGLGSRTSSKEGVE